MSDLYKTISQLCEQHEKTVYKMCKDIGIRSSVLSDLNTGRKKGLSTDTLTKIAEHFGVSVDFLLSNNEIEKAPAPEGERVSSDDDIKFALFGTREIDNDVLDRVKQFAKFAYENEKNK